MWNKKIRYYYLNKEAIQQKMILKLIKLYYGDHLLRAKQLNRNLILSMSRSRSARITQDFLPVNRILLTEIKILWLFKFQIIKTWNFKSSNRWAAKFFKKMFNLNHLKIKRRMKIRKLYQNFPYVWIDNLTIVHYKL